MSLLRALIRSKLTGGSGGEGGGGGGGSVSFTVENPIVAAYMANVNYDPSDYSTTDVISYYRTAASYRKDQPSAGPVPIKKAGLLQVFDKRGRTERTVSAGTENIYNLTPGAVVPYIVTDASGNELQSGTLKPEGNVRMIKCAGVNNMRDLGGWTCDGGKLKYGLLIRGGELENATAAEIVEINSVLNVADEIDLRNNSEISNDVSEFPNADYLHVQLGQYQGAVDLTNDTMLSRTVTVLRRIMENAEKNRTTYFHCVSGADRTGTIAFLLEAVCGVSRSDMDKDYELTCFTNEGESAARTRVLNVWKNLVGYIDGMDGATFRDKAVSWFLLAGFTIEEINDFREAVIDGNPETVTSQVDYSCKSVSLNKDTASIGQGESDTLTATIAPFWATGNVAWTTSDSSVVTASANGASATITGVSAGTAIITASCNGHTATCAITVRAAELVYTVASTGAVHGVKISSSDHTTETTGQAAYAATDYVSTTNHTHFRLSNNYDELSYGGTATNNVYLNWYDGSKNYISSTETVGTNQGAAMTPLTGTIPNGAAHYRLRAYCGEAAKREAWFDAFVVELGRYE